MCPMPLHIEMSPSAKSAIGRVPNDLQFDVHQKLADAAALHETAAINRSVILTGQTWTVMCVAVPEEQKLSVISFLAEKH